MLDQFIQDGVEESSVEGKMATLERVAALLVRVNNQTKRELYAGQLAGVLGLTNLQVKRALQEAATRAHRSHAAPECRRADGYRRGAGRAGAPASGRAARDRAPGPISRALAHARCRARG